MPILTPLEKALYLQIRVKQVLCAASVVQVGLELYLQLKILDMAIFFVSAVDMIRKFCL